MTSDLNLHAINNARQVIRDYLIETPVLPLKSSKIAPFLPKEAEFFLKLELFQHTGSFKARGAFLGVSSLDEDSARRGVVTVSGGNHALALSWAAKARGVPVKVVMKESADPMRIQGCRDLGAEVVLEKDMIACFDAVARIREEEGRRYLHPFNDPTMILGSATCGAEFVGQAEHLDVVVLPIGGGGLISGMASAIKLINPETLVIGVEPEGCDNMSRGLAAGHAIVMDRIDTIADSLGAPETLEYSLNIVRQMVDEVITIPDAALAAMMLRIRDSLSMMVEPACATSLAAALGPLRDRLRGKRVGVLACGSNTSADRWHENTHGYQPFSIS
ncbi:MAG: threonine/serine dehydratase [Proteobacteria bacterium]|nr:threonine/serine dehydratase [Pseudomonadota bacterium]